MFRCGSEQYCAILASPNAVGPARFLTQHQHEMGGLTITAITESFSFTPHSKIFNVAQHAATLKSRARNHCLCFLRPKRFLGCTNRRSRPRQCRQSNGVYAGRPTSFRIRRWSEQQFGTLSSSTSQQHSRGRVSLQVRSGRRWDDFLRVLLDIFPIASLTVLVRSSRCILSLVAQTSLRHHPMSIYLPNPSIADNAYIEHYQRSKLRRSMPSRKPATSATSPARCLHSQTKGGRACPVREHCNACEGGFNGRWTKQSETPPKIESFDRFAGTYQREAASRRPMYCQT